MPPPLVKLKHIIDAIDSASDELTSILDRQTGEVIVVFEADLDFQEGDDIDAAPEWQRPMIAALLAVREGFSDRYVRLPSKFEIHEWSILNDFGHSLEEPGPQQDVLDAIHSAGAFRRFRAVVTRHGLLDRWYAFKAGRCRELALRWCERNRVEFDGG